MSSVTPLHHLTHTDFSEMKLIMKFITPATEANSLPVSVVATVFGYRTFSGFIWLRIGASGGFL